MHIGRDTIDKSVSLIVIILNTDDISSCILNEANGVPEAVRKDLPLFATKPK